MKEPSSILKSLPVISLKDASINKDKGMAKAKPFFTQLPSCEIQVGAIEKAMVAIYDDNETWQEASGGYNPRKCDAVYINGESLTLIEFKSGSTNYTDLHRKLYDTILALMEHDGLSFSKCRQNVTYVVVLPPDDRKSNADKVIDYVSDESIDHLWKLDNHQAQSGLSNLLWLINNVIILTPRQFNLYVQEMEWTNMLGSSNG